MSTRTDEKSHAEGKADAEEEVTTKPDTGDGAGASGSAGAPDTGETDTGEEPPGVSGTDGADIGDSPARRWTTWLRGRRGRAVAIALLVVALLVGGGSALYWRLTALPEGAALRAAGVVVTEADLNQRMQTLRALYGVRAPDDPAGHDRFLRDAAKSVAVSAVLDRAAVDRGIAVADKEADDVLNRFVAEAYGSGGRAGFVQALGQVGTSEAAVRDEVRRQLVTSRLTDQVVGEVTVGDDELRAIFDQRRAELATPERRTLRHVVVDSEASARSVLDALRSGTPFETVAAERSLDTSTKTAGGALGEVAQRQLEPAFGAAAFAARPGEPFGPVHAGEAWYVGRVDAVAPSVDAEFGKVAEQLRSTVIAERSADRWREWLTGALRDSDVRYTDRYRPADPDGVAPGPAPAEPGTGAPAPGTPEGVGPR